MFRTFTFIAVSVVVCLAGVTSAALSSSAQPRVAIDAVFERRSYAPGETARLTFWSRPETVHVQIYRAGPPGAGFARHGALTRAAVTGFSRAVAGRRITVAVGNWPSGLYFARLTGDGRVGYAVFVVRPRRLGEHRVAVVLPTNTWHAYNFRDVDHDGVGDTWYADRRIPSVDMSRPFEDGGVPPHYRHYDRGFLHWLALHGRHADVLGDDDLDRVASGDALARLYDLVVFPGHEEYVTAHEYDVVTRYRDLGGNLAFLSANNFFVRVRRGGQRLFHTGRWRDLGRPESALVGIQYLDWNQERWANAPYVVVGREEALWLFRGTGLRNGSQFGIYGIEIDARTAASPRAVRVLARVPDVFGPGRSAEMTYYTTRRGAKVFAAGTMNFGGSALWPTTSRLLDNLWRELSRP